MTYTKINNENFREEILESKQPVMVEFFTDWSGSCHIIRPVMQELAEQFKTIIKFCRINMDEQPEIAREYGIRKIPTILFFKDGQIADFIKGVIPKTIIVEKLNIILQP